MASAEHDGKTQVYRHYIKGKLFENNGNPAATRVIHAEKGKPRGVTGHFLQLTISTFAKEIFRPQPPRGGSRGRKDGDDVPDLEFKEYECKEQANGELILVAGTQHLSVVQHSGMTPLLIIIDRHSNETLTLNQDAYVKTIGGGELIYDQPKLELAIRRFMDTITIQKRGFTNARRAVSTSKFEDEDILPCKESFEKAIISCFEKFQQSGCASFGVDYPEFLHKNLEEDPEKGKTEFFGYLNITLVAKDVSQQLVVRLGITYEYLKESDAVGAVCDLANGAAFFITLPVEVDQLKEGDAFYEFLPALRKLQQEGHVWAANATHKMRSANVVGKEKQVALFEQYVTALTALVGTNMAARVPEQILAEFPMTVLKDQRAKDQADAAKHEADFATVSKEVGALSMMAETEEMSDEDSNPLMKAVETTHGGAYAMTDGVKTATETADTTGLGKRKAKVLKSSPKDRSRLGGLQQKRVAVEKMYGMSPITVMQLKQTFGLDVSQMEVPKDPRYPGDVPYIASIHPKYGAELRWYKPRGKTRKDRERTSYFSMEEGGLAALHAMLTDSSKWSPRPDIKGIILMFPKKDD